MSDPKDPILDEPSLSTVEPIAAPPPVRPSEHPRVSQGQMVAVSVQPQGSAEAQLLQRLPPEHLHKAIESSARLQLRNLDLQEKELNQGDADRERLHVRAMKAIDLRGENDRGMRRLAAIVLLAVAVFVTVVVLREKYDMAEKIIYALVGAFGGYVTGRAAQKQPPQK